MGAKTKQVAHESEMHAYNFLPQSEMRQRMEPNPDPSHNISEDSNLRGRQDKTQATLPLRWGEQKGVLTLKYKKES
jgi:hypothetical protein